MESVIKKLVTQTGNDTFTAGSIDTNLTVDGGKGWEITAMEAYWSDGAAVAAGDWSLSAVCNITGASTTYADDAEICRVSWGLQNTGGVAVSVPYEPLRAIGLLVPRVTVAPIISVCVQSSGTAQANDVIFRLYYNIVSLKDAEVYKLRFAGG